MLGRAHDAEDVVQHTFLAADAAFRAGDVPRSVRAWLYTVARNRCVSILRARRDLQPLPDPCVPSAENLAEDVEHRDDLRALLADLRTLPDDQRAALLLAELGELSHAEVAQVIGVRPRKVKALVYQARRALLAAAGARAIPCRSIRAELEVATGSALRRRHLRDHIASCDGCRAYSEGRARQRASLAAILPVVPTVALRDGVLASLGGGATAAATGGASAGLGVAGAKLLAIAAIGGAAAGGGTVAVTAPDEPRAERRAAPAAQHAPAQPAAAAPARAVPQPARLAPAAPAAGRPAARDEPVRRAARGSAKPSEPVGAAERPGSRPPEPPGLARQEKAPSKAKPEQPGPQRSNGPPAAAQPARDKPVPPGQLRKAEPAAALPPGQAKEPKQPPAGQAQETAQPKQPPGRLKAE